MNTAIRATRIEVETLRKSPALWLEPNFEARVEAIDALEFNTLDEAKVLAQELEDLNQKLFRNLRAKLRPGTDVREMIQTHITMPLKNPHDEEGYDNLDLFLNGLFSMGPIPAETNESDPEMVFYQKTPGRVILDMVDKAGFTGDDVFYDLGSGLGQVPLLVNLLSGVRAKGVEIEPAYVRYSEQSATALGIQNVTFVEADVRAAGLSDGTVFFLYTPFTGGMLEEVLGKLQKESEQRVIRVFTYGPCTLDISQKTWLRSDSPIDPNPHRLAAFKSL